MDVPGIPAINANRESKRVRRRRSYKFLGNLMLLDFHCFYSVYLTIMFKFSETLKINLTKLLIYNIFIQAGSWLQQLSANKDTY